MNRILTTIITSASFVYATLAIGGIADLHFVRPSSVMAAPGPGSEMERLQKFYLGVWEYTETYPKGPFAPNGGQNTGIYTSELGPGGNSVINRFHSKGPVGDFEGMLIMTWDPKEKSYKSYIFGNDFPGGIVETGNFEGDALVFRGEMSAGDSRVSMRSKTSIDAKGIMTNEELVSMGGKPEELLVRAVATRKP